VLSRAGLFDRVTIVQQSPFNSGGQPQPPELPDEPLPDDDEPLPELLPEALPVLLFEPLPEPHLGFFVLGGLPQVGVVPPATTSIS
jgi:hypothetical protein